MSSEPSGARILTISHAQLESLRLHLMQGAERAAQNLCASQFPDCQIAVGSVGLCLLADFPSAAVCAAGCDGDVSAGVLIRFEGPFALTALLALDPEDALRWVRCRDSESDVVETYKSMAGTLLRGLVRGADAAFDCAPQPGSPSLEEQSVVASLLATHAPSDTVVLSANLELGTRDRELPAQLYLLLDPKRLTGMIEVLAGASAS